MRPIESKAKIGLCHLEKVVRDAANRSLDIALDIETTGLTLYEDRITWISWCTDSGYGAIPVRHRNLGSARNDSEFSIKKVLRVIHRNPKNRVIWHNASFDLSMLVANDWLSLDDIEARLYDTMLVSYLLNPVKTREGGRHSLKYLYDEHLRGKNEEKQPDFETTCGGLDFQDVALEKAAFYAAFDSYTTYHLASRFDRLYLPRDPSLKRYLELIEIPHLLTTVEIMTTGMKIVPENETAEHELRSIGELQDEFESVKQRVFDLLGRTFNFGSPDAMRRVLFHGDLPLRPHGTTRSGRYLIDKDTLARALCDKSDPAVRKVLGLILYGKQLATTIMKHTEMYDHINRVTGRIHPQIRPTTSSGRYAGSRPNTLSLSSSSGIKEHLVAGRGKIFVIGDFSQIDLRVIANETGELKSESKMLDDVNSGIDLHLNTLKIVDQRANHPNWKKLWKKEKELLGIIPFKGKNIRFKGAKLAELESIKDSRSNVAKPINFGVSYGLGPSKLLLNLNTSDEFRETIIDGVPTTPGESNAWKKWLKKVERAVKREEYTIEDVKSYLQQFHRAYPDIKSFQNVVEKDLVMGGITYNLFGKRCVTEILPHMGQCTLDIKITKDQWYRLRVDTVGMDKANVHCRLRQINRLKAIEPKKRGKIKTKDLKFEEGYEIYKLDEAKFHSTWRSYRGTCSYRKITDDLRRLHEEALWDCDDFFEHVKIAPIPAGLIRERERSDYLPRPVAPYIFVPHMLIKKVRVDGTKLDLNYVGYDKLRRNLISARVSSTSMDFCKIAMIEFRRKARDRWPRPEERPRIINCIHDEIAIECSLEDQPEVQDILRSCMEDDSIFQRYVDQANGRKLLVKIEAEVGNGSSYAKAKP